MSILFRVIGVIVVVMILTRFIHMRSISKALGHVEVHTELFIEAEPEEIWSVITDAKNYERWNPVIIKAIGEYKHGAKIRNTLAEPGKKPVEVTSRVEIYEEPYHLNQFGGYVGIITFDHHYELEKVQGGTKVKQWEVYTGFYVHFWDSSWVEASYQHVNAALREEVFRRRKQ
jgi:hypothetical protein